MTARSLPINLSGPQCGVCRLRPDDPVWARVDGGTAEVLCLGCVASLRAFGRRVHVMRSIDRAALEDVRDGE